MQKAKRSLLKKNLLNLLMSFIQKVLLTLPPEMN
ncbi:hypothetical protein KBTX_03900 [wastewater metagenome]|uniref:Uncharacterized protein n=2 Tax=unclassified sequences TaxID=12908 RepID=A0A5B8RIM1_9ZZZZ|nr:hypothetical protein KBTEX_03900 [uncultured organism]